jgi:hypothetical protein
MTQGRLIRASALVALPIEGTGVPVNISSHGVLMTSAHERGVLRLATDPWLASDNDT